MKKILLLLLVSSFTLTMYAQEATDSTQDGKLKIKTDDSKTKIKDNKAKSKDENGDKIKIKEGDGTDNGMNNDSKTKIKDKKVKSKDENGDKIKVKSKDGDASTDTDGEGKTKIKMKSDGSSDMQNGTSGTMTNGMSTGTMNTTTTTTVVTMGGWTTNPANLPVIGNNVSPDVVTAVKNRYGNTIYDIKQIRSTSGQLIYVVRVMDNGNLRTDYVGADGNTVSQ